MNNDKRLTLSKDDKKICGVCGGVAKYFNCDPTIIRIGYIAILFCTAVVPGIIAYFLMAMVMPEEK